MRPGSYRRESEIIKEQAWVESIRNVLNEKTPETLNSGDKLSWSAFHAQNIREEDIPPKAIIGILPPFEEKSSTVPMCKHAMEKVKELTEFCNPGQTPVCGSDLPIYTICKQVQWRWTIYLGEDKFVLMMGPLHIEFVIEAIEAKLLEKSGFIDIIRAANILTSGRAESVVAGTDKHLKRVRYTHQVFLAACLIIKEEEYERHINENGLSNKCEKKKWIVEMTEKNLMFAFCSSGLWLMNKSCLS